MQTRIPKPKTGNENSETEKITMPIAPNVQDTLNKAKQALQESQKQREDKKSPLGRCGC